MLLIGGGGLVYQALRADAGDEARLDVPVPAQKPDDPVAKQPPAKPDSAKPVVVTAVKPKKGVLDRITKQPSSLLPAESVEVYSQVNGVLKEVLVDIGDKVKKGQVLAVIDAPDRYKDVELARTSLELAKAKIEQQETLVVIAQAELKGAQTGVAQREAELNAAQAAVVFRKSEFDRHKKLKDQGVVPANHFEEQKEKLDAAEGKLTLAKIALETALGEKALKQNQIQLAQSAVKIEKIHLDSAKVGLEKAEAFVNYTRLTAPFDGVVTKRFLNTGDSLAAKNQVPVVKINRTNVMRLVISVPERDAVFIHVGLEVDLYLGALNEEFSGLKVSRFSPSLDPKTQAMRIEVDIPNPKGLLLEGMYGSATIKLGKTKPGVLLLPTSCVAVMGPGKSAFVYVVRDGKARLTQIQPGIQQGNTLEALSGLSADDLVVTEPLGLNDGQAVTFKQAPK